MTILLKHGYYFKSGCSTKNKIKSIVYAILMIKTCFEHVGDMLVAFLFTKIKVDVSTIWINLEAFLAIIISNEYIVGIPQTYFFSNELKDLTKGDG